MPSGGVGRLFSLPFFGIFPAHVFLIEIREKYKFRDNEKTVCKQKKSGGVGIFFLWRVSVCFFRICVFV